MKTILLTAIAVVALLLTVAVLVAAGFSSNPNKPISARKWMLPIGLLVTLVSISIVVWVVLTPSLDL